MNVNFSRLILILVVMFLIYYFFINVNNEGFMWNRYGPSWDWGRGWGRGGWGRRRMPNRYRRPVLYENVVY